MADVGRGIKVEKKEKKNDEWIEKTNERHRHTRIESDVRGCRRTIK